MPMFSDVYKSTESFLILRYKLGLLKNLAFPYSS